MYKLMRMDSTGGLDVIAALSIWSRRAPAQGVRHQDFVMSLFAEPVIAHAVEGCFEIFQDDGIAEAFEDERELFRGVNKRGTGKGCACSVELG